MKKESEETYYYGVYYNNGDKPFALTTSIGNAEQMLRFYRQGLYLSENSDLFRLEELPSPIRITITEEEKKIKVKSITVSELKKSNVTK